jgi:aspartate kinase
MAPAMMQAPPAANAVAAAAADLQCVGGQPPPAPPPDRPCTLPLPRIRSARKSGLAGETMPLLVMKFGGTSVADLARIENAAKKVEKEVARGYDVIVIVSAMSGETNRLVGYVEGTSKLYDAREYDAVVASGENVTAGLMALRLQEMGIPARSWQGWQVPIQTTAQHGSARFVDIPRANIDAKFAEGFKVAVVAGFQGVSPEGRVTTLGRGGSDTTAVAFAAAFGAERCDIYTDVDGVYTTDPRIVSKATRLDRVSFEEMLEMASLGSKVLQVRSVEIAMVHRVPTYVRSSFDDPENPRQGTLICDEEDIVEQQIVTGIAYSKDEAQITLRRVADKPGVAASIFGPLAEANINVDMIIQVVSDDQATTDITFTVPTADFDRARTILEGQRGSIQYQSLQGATDVVKVSAIGIGMRSHAGVAARAFRALADKGINIRAITTSEIKFSVLIDAAYTELAVRTLHTLYGLDNTA